MESQEKGNGTQRPEWHDGIAKKIMAFEFPPQGLWIGNIANDLKIPYFVSVVAEFSLRQFKSNGNRLLT